MQRCLVDVHRSVNGVRFPLSFSHVLTWCQERICVYHGMTWRLLLAFPEALLISFLASLPHAKSKSMGMKDLFSIIYHPSKFFISFIYFVRASFHSFSIWWRAFQIFHCSVHDRDKTTACSKIIFTATRETMRNILIVGPVVWKLAALRSQTILMKFHVNGPTRIISSMV